MDVPSYSGSAERIAALRFFQPSSPTAFGAIRVRPVGDSRSGIPSRFSAISGRGYQPYIQFPWSHAIAYEWAASGMFTLTWYMIDSTRNPTFDPPSHLKGNSGRPPICSSSTSATTTIGDLLIFSTAADLGGSPTHSRSIFTPGSLLTPPRWITISGSGTPSVSITYLEQHLEIHHDLIVLAKTFGVALAVGLDVLAVSVGVGVTQIALNARFRLGVAFASSEIIMQVVGYGLGTGAGKILGEVAAYIGFALLALVGAFLIRDSLRNTIEAEFEATRGVGLLMTSLSISLDSLGVGVALPATAIQLLPLLITLSITITVFTFIGLAFGSRLGERYERGAERLAGIILIILAALFTVAQILPNGKI
jgi:manganese efflux pump family protein